MWFALQTITDAAGGPPFAGKTMCMKIINLSTY